MNVEEKAIELAMEYERRQGRTPRNVKKDRKAVGYDVLSDGRKIEVKGIGDIRNSFFLFNNYNFEGLRNNPDFWLYVVFNVNSEPKLIIYDRLTLLEKLMQSKISFQFEVSIRKDERDRGISV